MKQETSPRTISFLFTDIENSTRLLKRLGTVYQKVLADHHLILRNSIKKYGGREVDNAGDGFFIVYDNAMDAVLSAREIQESIDRNDWPDGIELKVRMGIHTGEAIVNETGYVGIEIHKASRIGASGHGGQVLASGPTVALVLDKLPEDLSFRELGEYDLRDFDKPEKIYQLIIPGLKSDFSLLKTSTHKKNNLPSDLVKLIGRESELEKVRNLLLKKEIRIVTLTGPGGTGKTSLAYRVSESLLGNFRDGVYAVLLASIFDPSLVANTIAQSLGILERQSKTVMETLKDFLCDKEILLFMDNYEQIVSSADILSELLENCPGLKILVTSRVKLYLKNEVEYFVPPLSLPILHSTESIESLSQYSAVRLFIERAKSVMENFTVTNENAPAIAEICVKLDGLPLAIELASARIKLFTPQMILSRLSSKLDILKSTSRSLPERHQTLRQAISWSYDLLSDDEKKLFRWMSIFVGGSTLEAIENIFSKMETLKLDTLDGIEALIDKSLLRRKDSDDEDPRFYMLETIREFSGESLKDDEKKLLDVYHLEYFLSVAQEAQSKLTGKDQRFWLNKIQADHYNFRRCLRFAYETNDVHCGLKLCGALWRFWLIRGNLIEGYKEIKKFITKKEAENYPADLAHVLNAAGTLVHEISNFREALPLLERSLEIYKELDDKRGIANALNNISWVESRMGNIEKARTICAEALLRNQELGDKRGISVSLNNSAWIYFFQGNFLKGNELCRENLRLKKEIGEERGLAFSLTNLAWTETMLGNFDTAMELLNESSAILETLRDRQLIAWTNTIIGILKYATGLYKESSRLVAIGIELMGEIGNEWGVGFECCMLGHLKYILGDTETAIELLEKSDRIHNDIGSIWGSKYVNIYFGYIFSEDNKTDEALASYRKALGISVQLLDRYGLASCFECIASEYIKLNKIKEAGVLMGTSIRIRDEIRSPLFAFEKNIVEKDINFLIDKLGKDFLNESSAVGTEDVLKIAMS